MIIYDNVYAIILKNNRPHLAYYAFVRGKDIATAADSLKWLWNRHNLGHITCTNDIANDGINVRIHKSKHVSCIMNTRYENMDDDMRTFLLAEYKCNIPDDIWANRELFAESQYITQILPTGFPYGVIIKHNKSTGKYTIW